MPYPERVKDPEVREEFKKKVFVTRRPYEKGASQRYTCSLQEVIRHLYPEQYRKFYVSGLSEEDLILLTIKIFGAQEAEFIFAKTQDLISWKNERDVLETKIRVVTDNWKH